MSKLIPRTTRIIALLVISTTVWTLDGTKTSTSTEAGLARSNSDDRNDIQEFADYQKAIAQLFEQDKFAELDKIANSARSRKEKFPGGFWKLHTIYSAIEKPRLHATEEDWQDHLERLRRWVSANPDSITARIALAKSYASYAWSARGDGFADTVSASGWRLFSERLQTAKDILDQASVLRVKCPEWYVAMQTVALGQSWDLSQAQELLEQASRFEPGYYYRSHANFLSPRWNGGEGDSATFAKQVADRIGGSAGDIVYFQIASAISCHCVDEEMLSSMSWRRIQRGFTELEKQFGTSGINVNAMAYLAIKKPDAIVADRMFRRIGDNRDDEVWSQKYFDQVKSWAAMVSPGLASQQLIKETAHAHIQSPEGARYAKEVSSRLAPLLQDCSNSTKGDSVVFTLYIEINKDGGMEQMMVTSEMSPTARCSFQKMNEWQVANATPFAPPPQASYWLSFEIDPNTKIARVSTGPQDED